MPRTPRRPLTRSVRVAVTPVQVAPPLAVGARVEGGETPSDYDTGRVVAVDGDQATVAWDSGVATTQLLSLLRPEGEHPVACSGSDE